MRLLPVLLLALAALILAACNSEGGGGGTGTAADEWDPNGSADLAGSAQKGPFRQGADLTARPLNGDGTPAERSATAEVGAKGAFSLDDLDWSGPTLIEIEGDFFDEVAGNFAGSERRLALVANLADGEQPTLNVNLYTHLVAARTAALMNGGDSFDAAQSIARDNLGDLVGIEHAPADLNLLDTLAEASDALESDSANLLMFSAAVLSVGLDQAAIDALAEDFADDGEIDGDGLADFAALVNAQDDNLLEDARLALINQYSTEPPNSGRDHFAWILNGCALARFQIGNQPVFCLGEDDADATLNRAGTGDETHTVVLVAETGGHYWLEVVPEKEPEADSVDWTLYDYSDQDGPHACDDTNINHGFASGFSFAEARTDRLDRGDWYCLEFDVTPSDGGGGPGEISINWFPVSEGSGSDLVDLVPLELDEPYHGLVGGEINNSFDSYYSFRVPKGGEYSIRVDNYSNGGSGSIRIGLFHDDDRDGDVSFYNDADRIEFVGGHDDTTEVELTRTLESGGYALRLRNLTDYRGSSITGYGPEGDNNPVEFRVQITSP